MLDKAGVNLAESLTGRLNQPFFLFQYADDALLFSTTQGQAVHTLKLVLDFFSQCSGLTINYNKSSFVPLNLPANLVQEIGLTLGCQPTTLPITYLGLPLTLKKSDRLCFQPLIEKLQRRLATWKGKLISRAGRLQLISSVLTFIPIYHLSCFLLPRWLIHTIERICRRFLWESSTSGIPLKSWASICLPKLYGGLGLSDIAL